MARGDRNARTSSVTLCGYQKPRLRGPKTVKLSTAVAISRHPELLASKRMVRMGDLKVGNRKVAMWRS